MSRTLLVYSLTRPGSAAIWTVVLAFSLVYGLLAQEWTMAIAYSASICALALLLYLRFTRGLRRAYRSATVVRADCGTDAVTIVGNGITNRIEYHRIDGVRQTADAVLLRITRTREVVMLAAPLLPPAAGDLLRAAGIPGVR